MNGTKLFTGKVEQMINLQYNRVRTQNIVKFNIVLILTHLLIWVGNEQPGWRFLSWVLSARVKLPDVPPPGAAEAEVEEVVGRSLAAVEVGPETEWPFWPSTGFLERWRPRFICRSQYF